VSSRRSLDPSPSIRLLPILAGIVQLTEIAAVVFAAPALTWYVDSLCPDDGIVCTHEALIYDQCEHRPNHDACPSDGVFCNGEERCVAEWGGCVSSGSPCGGVTPCCDEVAGRCVACRDESRDQALGDRKDRGPDRPPTREGLRFDGIDDVVTARPSDALEVRRAMTLEAWIRPLPDPRPQAGGVIAGKDGEFLLVRNPDGTLRWALNVRSPGFLLVDAGPAATPEGAWSHVALAYDGSIVRVYVNGVRVSAWVISGPIVDASPPGDLFHIGGSYAEEQIGCFAGLIDEVRLWNVARSGAAIAAGRYHRFTGSESGLVGYWSLEEGSGGVTIDAARGNPANLDNGTQWVRTQEVPTSFYSSESSSKSGTLPPRATSL
jgi:concanavalin A-like lectin/glucanase superfamily protein